ncbi:7051_t:CDS:2, partial [Ambispora gerdemannii]
MSEQSTQLERYGGRETLARIPTRNNIISECDNGLTAILQQNLSNKKPIHFMPNDVKPEEHFECIVIEREDHYNEYGKKISWK